MEKKKIYWAFDPYSDEKEHWLKVTGALKALKSKFEMDVHPVYFVDDKHRFWYGNSVPQEKETHREILKAEMSSQLEKISDLELSEPEVIFSDTSTKRGLAKFITNFLDENGADFVVLNTHSRKGLKRAFLGSFAESLLWHCHVPQMLVSPKTEPTERMDRVFYPSGLESNSLELFTKFLDLDLSRGTHLDLYSKIIAPSEHFESAMKTALGGNWLTPKEYDEKERTRIQEKFQPWIEKAHGQGVEVELFIDGTEGRLPDRLLEAANHLKADLVVIPSFVSKMDAVLVGSVALEVVRNSTVPVLIQHFKE